MLGREGPSPVPDEVNAEADHEKWVIETRERADSIRNTVKERWRTDIDDKTQVQSLARALNNRGPGELDAFTQMYENYPGKENVPGEFTK